jgi:hypothetical protein
MIPKEIGNLIPKSQIYVYYIKGKLIPAFQFLYGNMNLLDYLNFIILFENMLFPEERRIEEKKEEFLCPLTRNVHHNGLIDSRRMFIRVALCFFHHLYKQLEISQPLPAMPLIIYLQMHWAP